MTVLGPDRGADAKSYPRPEPVDNMRSAAMPSRRERAIVAFVVALVYGALTEFWFVSWHAPTGAMDFTFPWWAARALLAGLVPYVVVARTPTVWNIPFLYPAPAAVEVLPFALLPARGGGVLFVGIGMGWLAWHL